MNKFYNNFYQLANISLKINNKKKIQYMHPCVPGDQKQNKLAILCRTLGI